MLNKDKNPGKGFCNLIIKTLSLIAEKDFTLEKTHAPGAARSSFIILLNEYSKSEAITFLPILSLNKL